MTAWRGILSRRHSRSALREGIRLHLETLARFSSCGGKRESRSDPTGTRAPQHYLHHAVRWHKRWAAVQTYDELARNKWALKYKSSTSHSGFGLGVFQSNRRSYWKPSNRKILSPWGRVADLQRPLFTSSPPFPGHPDGFLTAQRSDPRPSDRHCVLSLFAACASSAPAVLLEASPKRGGLPPPIVPCRKD
jgi:hypothetical protein